MGSRVLEPTDPEAKRYEDIRKSNLEPGAPLPDKEPKTPPKQTQKRFAKDGDDKDTED